jgi:hypothetical protein
VRTRLAIPVAALAVAALAGCGSPPHHSLEKTRACLVGEGLRVTVPTGDFVASTATEGSFRVHLDGAERNFVTIWFGADDTEAAATAAGYNRFHGKNIGLADILAIDKNAVMLWRSHPSPQQEALVRDCLT